jgi:hypothetical protein
MNENSNIVRLRQHGEIDDPLTDILRSGARRLLAQAIEMEAEAFLAGTKDLKLPDGRDRLVRHGHGPAREIQTGIGPVEVSRVKIRDRGAPSEAGRIRFTSAILPRWARRSKSLTWGALGQGLVHSRMSQTPRAVSVSEFRARLHDAARFRARSTSHTVAVRDGCTNIPFAAGGGSGGRNHSGRRHFRPWLFAVRPPGSAELIRSWKI